MFNLSNRQVTDLTELNATPADGDLLHIVDISDTTDDPEGTSKKVTRANLVGGLALQADLTDHVADVANPHSVDATDVGLGNVDNTSDATKNAATATLTNKRITKRVSTEASSATPTIDTDDVDAHSITALATAITSMTTNLSGTPTNFQTLIIRILDNGTARAIAWGASFEARGVALPTATIAGKLLTVGFIYDTVDDIWGCVASVQEV